MPDRPLLLVTGGSRGIGAAICRLAAARGYDIAFSYQSDEAAAEGVAAALRASGARVLCLRADVASESDILALFAAIDGFGRLTHVANNAGITGKSSRLDVAPTDVIRAAIDVNVTGAILVAREAIKRISTAHGGSGGSIVNISSAAATLGAPGEFVWYAASKAAMEGLTAGLSKELAQEGVRVNSVQPGITDTDIHARSSGDPARMGRIAPAIPLKRPGKPDEIAEAVLFLMSDAASYITGAVLRVAGGR